MIWSLILALLLTGAAAAAADGGVLVRVPHRSLPFHLLEGDLQVFKEGIRRQLSLCPKLQGTRRFGSRRVSAKIWCTKTSKTFLSIAERSRNWKDLWRRSKRRFDWFRSTGRDKKGEIFYTGYYSPLIEASSIPTDEFSAPLLRKPNDLALVRIDDKEVWRKKNPDGTFSMYFNREEIEERGALKGQGLEIAYLRNPFESFVFQVQGAGTLRLRTPGGEVRTEFLNYAAQNGHPYVSIGKILREQGVPKEYLSLPGMRRYFKEHPEELRPILNRNPSFVFFSRSEEGPYGSLPVVLSPGHSIATDHEYFPFGAVAMISTVRPVFEGDVVKEKKRFSRLVLNQDIGGAIRGPGRVDVFWGEDRYAELAAGHMQDLGTLYFAVAK